VALVGMLLAHGLAHGAGSEPALPPPAVMARFKVVADGIPDSLGSNAGDSARGRALIVARDAANCVLCHAVPDPAVRFSGNIGPSLAGVGQRMSPAQIRLRVVDSLRLDPHTIMPSYYRVDGLDRVAAAYRGRPILDAAQIEDIVAYLGTLR
jgi:L-cysteine S-thiosulfotransferase